MFNGLGLYSDGEAIIFYRKNGEEEGMHALESNNGLDFFSPKDSKLSGKTGKPESISKCSDFRISALNDGAYGLLYKHVRGAKSSLYAAHSTDLFNWISAGSVTGISEIGMIVPGYEIGGKHVMFFGEQSIQVAYSKDLKTWKKGATVLEPRTNAFDSSPLTMGTVGRADEGIVVLYYSGGNGKPFSVGIALFDKDDPEKMLWRSDNPLWETPSGWLGAGVRPLGIADNNGIILLYWENAAGEVYAVHCAPVEYSGSGPAVSPKLARFEENPLIKPRPQNPWESRATFNAAAFEDKGKVHIFYRALGDDDISRIGYATSSDGENLDERLSQPIYVPREFFEGVNASHSGERIAYISGGGGRGGCEDPRIVKIGDRLYMTFVAFNGWNSVRMALTSIDYYDFLARRWNWKKPVLISPPGETHKNWMLFPEKINGKFAILHSISPKISIDYFDSLDEFDGSKFIQSKYVRPPQRDDWDSWIRGAGAPPIKTEYGWLLLYHAMDYRDPNRYKLGAMLLDLEHPENILHRCKKPILEPDECYENLGWKPGVIYSCGAVVKDGKLIVYYGGADMVVCMASADIGEFLRSLTTTEEPKLEKVSMPVKKVEVSLMA